MICAEITHDSQLAKRYQPIAGPFYRGEDGLFDRVLAHLHTSGARVTTAPEREGTSIYRLRSECETLEETATRLRRKSTR